LTASGATVPAPRTGATVQPAGGELPLSDNIDELAGYGVDVVVEPDVSLRTPDIELACQVAGITLVQTGCACSHY
jgi:AICAR transformylase/IMP cyclohydrolase PurH